MPSILILGATSDMGAAIASKFAADGYHILLTARNKADIANLASDIKIRFDVPCEALQFDAENFQTHQAFYQSITTKPDVVVAVFGYMGDNDEAIASQSEAIRTVNVNYTGAVSILNIVAQDFAERKTGVIAGVSSVAGERGRKSNFIYGSAKAGFTAYLSGLRNKYFESGVHVLTVLPGFVYTKMTENLKLPPSLTATPEYVASKVYKAVAAKKNIIYVKPVWRYIMMIIKCIPEPVFKKLSIG